ncbi:MAG: MetQ/NlpA family ABC transporter substrate-binding protein [Holosporales bacterium]|jgi:D-methionine transport system substrate-binding protein|nr:MetQ/NlpA family ABC transporter substrate-binding protein [Holosporales bacterium]
MKKVPLISAILWVQCFVSTAFCDRTVRIGATPVPHAEILNFVKEDLKKEEIDLDVIEFTDYITPNIALNDKSLDAHFYQHQPYFENFTKEHDMKFVSLAAIHIEPLGFYSSKIKKITELKDGAVIAIPNDPTNEGRALLLCQSNGLIKLNPEAGLKSTLSDITENPKNLVFKELEAAQLPRVLPDVEGAVINGNYAIEAGFHPSKDALFMEGKESLYVNIIVTRQGMEHDARLQKLVKALKTEKVRHYILRTYDGSVIPAF